MLVHVHSQEQACALAPIPNTVVISITNPGQTAALLEGWDAVLRVKFHGANEQLDKDPPRGTFPGYSPKPLTLCTEEIAREIDGFCHANHMKDIVVHCMAGLHRSEAVARYLRDVFDADVFNHVPTSPDSPNTLTYQLLMRPYVGMTL